MRILHCLNWDLSEVKRRIPEIADQKFDAVQINPLQPLKEDNKENWWLSYQPCGFTIGNQYGKKEDLIQLCQVASQYKIRIIGDVIITHMAQKAEMTPHDRVDSHLTDNPYVWREKKNLKGDWEYNDRYKVTHYCAGNLPGLNLYNWDLQDQIIQFLNECIDCGMEGFRIDSGKSIPLPTDEFSPWEGRDARPCDFFLRMQEGLKKKDLWIYIEVLNTAPDLIRKYFPFGLVLTDVEQEELPREALVSFVESHDQYYNWRPGMISPISDTCITDWYCAKAKYFPNTLYYARPFSEEWKNPKMKEANQQKVLKR